MQILFEESPEFFATFLFYFFPVVFMFSKKTPFTDEQTSEKKSETSPNMNSLGSYYNNKRFIHLGMEDFAAIDGKTIH